MEAPPILHRIIRHSLLLQDQAGGGGKEDREDVDSTLFPTSV